MIRNRTECIRSVYDRLDCKKIESNKMGFKGITGEEIFSNKYSKFKKKCEKNFCAYKQKNKLYP